MRKITLTDLKITEIHCTSEGTITFSYDVFDDSGEGVYTATESVDKGKTVMDQEFRTALMGIIAYVETKARSKENLSVASGV